MWTDGLTSLDPYVTKDDAMDVPAENQYIAYLSDGVNITHAEAIWILGTFRTSIIVNN